MTKPAVRSRMPPARPCLLGIVIGFALNWLWPWPVGPFEYVLPAGVLLTGLFVVIAVTGLRAFKRHGASPDETQETSAIIDTGPFRFSRNPSYVALATVQAALGLLFNNVWILLTLIPAMLVIHFVVVFKEEAYLEAKFGKEYLAYKSRVRRWI